MIANIPMHAMLPASDIERARRWYSEKLELEPASTNPFGDLPYEAGGVEFLVYQTELAPEPTTSPSCSPTVFEPVDFGEMGATVDGAITTPDGQKAAWFKYSEGNTFALSMAD